MAKYNKSVKLHISRIMFDYLHYHIQNNAPTFNYDIDVFYSIINDLSESKYSNKQEDDNGYIPMAGDYLKLKYGNHYFDYIRYLCNSSIVSRTKYHGKGVCLYYRLSEADTFIDTLVSNHYNSTYSFPTDTKYTLKHPDNTGLFDISKMVNKMDIVEVKIDVKSRVGKYIVKAYNLEKDRNKHSAQYIRTMEQYFKLIQIDTDSAMQHTIKKFNNDFQLADKERKQKKALNSCIQRIQSIFRITDGKKNRTLTFSRNPTNKRIDTNLTGLASDLRPFIIGYENLTYLDLTNSQPVLMNVLLAKHKPKANAKLLSEMALFEELTISGEWYPFLAKKFNILEDEAKKRWMLIAYSANDKLKGFKKQFSKIFPEIHDLMVKLKVKDYESFSVELQRIESKIFIDEICKELIENDILPYCIHDGVMVEKQDEEKTYEIMTKILATHLKRKPVIKINGIKRFPIDV